MAKKCEKYTFFNDDILKQLRLLFFNFFNFSTFFGFKKFAFDQTLLHTVVHIMNTKVHRLHSYYLL